MCRSCSFVLYVHDLHKPDHVTLDAPDATLADVPVTSQPCDSRADVREAVVSPAGSDGHDPESTSEDEMFRQQAADFSGLQGLIVQDPMIVGKLREVITMQRGSSSSSDTHVGSTLNFRAGFKEMNDLVKRPTFFRTQR